MKVSTNENGKTVWHEIDLAQVDQLDEISGDEQQALVWCETHQKYEWHWLSRDVLGTADE